MPKTRLKTQPLAEGYTLSGPLEPIGEAPDETAKVLVTSKVLHDAWTSLLEQNVPPETHPNQIKAFKRFFFAGARAFLVNLVYSDTLDENEPDTATQSDIDRIDAVQHEINEYFCEVAAGRQ